MRKALMTAALALALCGCSNTAVAFQDKENVGRFKAETGSVYIITDTRTHVQYLAWADFEKGGICVLVDRDGKPLLEGEGE